MPASDAHDPSVKLVRAARLVICGVVQGVGFRNWTQRTASRLGVSGWVRNLADGSVEAFACGDDRAVSDFIERCRRGPRNATVTSVTAHDGDPADGGSDFDILPMGS